ncbi:MAG: adenylosuccinate lyase, partial [Pseudomonadales bacterium]
RGQSITPEVLAAFLDSLDLPIEVREELKKMRPDTYLGNAIAQAKKI